MRQIGLTLLEMLIVLMLVSVLFVLAVPRLEWLILDARRTADINGFVRAVQLARSESAKRARPVVLCKSADLGHCGGADVAFESGWIVFVDTSGDSPPQRDPGEPLIGAHVPAIAGTIRSNRARYVFRPFYRRSTNGTVTFCDRRGPTAARAVIISYTGRPRISNAGPGGRRLVCAS